MRQIVLVSAIIMVLMIGAPSVYAESPYQSGYRHGVADANHKDPECAPHQFPCPPSTDYIHQPGKGFAFHTTAFVKGYINGWCSTANIGGHGAGGIEPNDEPGTTNASFDCDRGISSAVPRPSS